MTAEKSRARERAEGLGRLHKKKIVRPRESREGRICRKRELEKDQRKGVWTARGEREKA